MRHASSVKVPRLKKRLRAPRHFSRCTASQAAKGVPSTPRHKTYPWNRSYSLPLCFSEAKNSKASPIADPSYASALSQPIIEPKANNHGWLEHNSLTKAHAFGFMIGPEPTLTCLEPGVSRGTLLSRRARHREKNSLYRPGLLFRRVASEESKLEFRPSPR